MSDMNEVLRDFAAFADDDADVALDRDGTVVYLRDGREHEVRLSTAADTGLLVSVGGAEPIRYREFLARELGRLDVLAQRLLNRRASVPGGFIEAGARLDRAGEGRFEGTSLHLLRDECVTAPPFAVRLVFLTADAGHGKSALLREYQHQTARAFLQKRSPFLFWHVDLQGRQLLRLSEALMGDLGDLRVAGLWVAGIHRLVRAGSLVLAIDGFDELAAEQGSTDALGALATLIQELDDHGTVVAASRRAFFDSHDYLRRAGTFKRVMPQSCQFNQIELLPWTPEHGRRYFESLELDGARFNKPHDRYNELVSALGGEIHHPILTRPFLLYQAARALLEYGLTAGEFVRGMDDPHRGVAAVVQAFIEREVMEKWINRESGEPYLSTTQHMTILGDVAEEMYRAGRDRISLDLVETLVAMRLEEWGTPADRRQQIMEMARVHVLLRPPVDGDARQRAFDHPEFRDYFLAQALRSRITDAAEGRQEQRLVDFLTMAPLPDGAAKYVVGLMQLGDDAIIRLLHTLVEACESQLKATHLQANVGTLIPQVISGRDFADVVEVGSRSVVYSSLVFRGVSLQSVRFTGGQFLNVWLQDTEWTDVTLEGIQLGELTIDRGSTSFDGVRFVDSSVTGLRVREEGEEVDRAYAPHHVNRLLDEFGIALPDARQEEEIPAGFDQDTEFTKHVRRLLRHFYRSTVVTSYDLEQRFRKADVDPDSMVQLMVEHNVLTQETWKGAGQAQIWRLNCGIDDLLRAETGSGPANLKSFWRAVHEWS